MVLQLPDTLVPLLVWMIVSAGIAGLMFHDGTGAATNTASILAGRPIAVTSHGREQITLSHITAQRRREFRLAVVVVLAIVLVGAVLVVVSTP